MDINKIFKKDKVVIGMVHFPPLPGSPLYEDASGIKSIVERVRNDLVNLQDGGIDAVMFCNENDRPYRLHADYATVATMGRVIGEIIEEIKVPFGIDVLWDPAAAIALAKATGAKFIREVLTGTYISDMGLWNTNIGDIYRYKKLLDANEVAVFFNISAEFAYNLDRRPIEEIAKSVAFSSLADVILVSGPMTGVPPTAEMLKKVRENAKVPIFVNTGVNVNNVHELLQFADGVIVGTGLKKDGITWNPVDKERVKNFMKKVENLR
ncbi:MULTISPECIES: BtpA/SgcQ family protein [Thermoanaerobacter]|uniref:BtpA/SgcQ family protein n=1 Tax=Thermoanaerobacter TaxID=1754 RepID=UPI0005745146|nr:BtpA/SgcQ family protein [Thermoanaerobacter sp. YS13]KHO63033.1 SgcQ protein [Thermoanaerobacter sp. YS13]HHY80079.1 BtpA/SgcQ family protein [Thermoanaerobacter sp.]